MIDIFLSYDHNDRERIQPLIGILEAQGWTVWWDADIGIGVLFDMEIEAAIEAAGCIMVLWSEQSIESQWVRSEAHEGMDRNILVPVLLDDVRPPLPFGEIQACNFIDETRSTKADLEGLFEAVRHKLNTGIPLLDQARSAMDEDMFPLFVAEGLFMYLPAAEVKALVLALQQRFPGCELAAEFFNARWLRPWLKWLVDLKMRRHLGFGKDARFVFGIRSSRDVEMWNPGIELLDEWCAQDEPKLRRSIPKLLSRLELFRRILWIARYRLGRGDGIGGT